MRVKLARTLSKGLKKGMEGLITNYHAQSDLCEVEFDFGATADVDGDDLVRIPS
jgi:hypothetical protein